MLPHPDTAKRQETAARYRFLDKKLGLGLTFSRDFRPNDGGQNRNARN